jgi:hypothetical protein
MTSIRLPGLGSRWSEGKSHTGGAGTVFQEHQIGGGIRKSDPALQVDWHAVVRDLKRQFRDLLDVLKRGVGVAASASHPRRTRANRVVTMPIGLSPER